MVSQGASCKKGCPSNVGRVRSRSHQQFRQPRNSHSQQIARSGSSHLLDPQLLAVGHYRRGSANRIRSLGTNPREVEKAKEEYENDKFAKSAVESVRSRLAWWRKRAKETQGGSLPTHRGTLPAPGVFVEKSWLQVCWDVLERGEEPAWDTLGRMLWIWRCRKANVRAKGALGLLRSAVLLTCRSWQISLWVLIPCAQESPYSHAKKLCVALGGLCAKSSCLLPDACKSSSSKVKGVVAVFSICPSPKLTRRPSGRNARLRMFSLRWWRQVRVPGQGVQEVVTMVQFIMCEVVLARFQQ